jgi:methyltransferase
MVSRRFFFVFLGLLAVQRLVELRRSRQNEHRILQAGGIEFGRRQYPWMVAIHTGWFLSMILEVLRFNRPFNPFAAGFSLVGFWIGQALRYSAIRSLVTRWTVRVMVLPGSPPVTNGPYRVIRHPNYLGVLLEVLSVPLVHGAYLTAILFSLINLIWMKNRIRTEEAALDEAYQYGEVFQRTPRFIPTLPLEKKPA